MTPEKLLNNSIYRAFYGRFPSLMPAQIECIEPIITGKNMVLCSGTGSGKTEAVMAPLLSKYWNPGDADESLFLLYIAPTKALANDLEKRLKVALLGLGINVGIRHGDRDDLTRKKVPSILITTPESLEVMLLRNDEALLRIKAVVIDEVHLLYNTQRGLQLSILLQRLRKYIDNDFQWAALSATIGKPEYISDFMFGGRENCCYISHPSSRDICPGVRLVNDLEEFSQLIFKLLENNKVKLLIFAKSRKACESIAYHLKQFKPLQHCCFVHYSSLSHESRLDIEKKFAFLETAICIATSTLELGIDIGDINAAVLWDTPSNVESFLQRIGRSNRRTNKTNVICIVQKEKNSVILDSIQYLAQIEVAKRSELAIKEPYELYGAVSQQLLAFIASRQGSFTKLGDLYEICSHLPYLTKDSIEIILDNLVEQEYLKHHGFKKQYGADEKLYKLIDLKMIYSNFALSSQMIDVFQGTQLIGEVPRVNSLKFKAHDMVRFQGKCWKIQKITPNEIVLQVNARDHDATTFYYDGSSVQIDPYIIERSWQIIHSETNHDEILLRDLISIIREFRSDFQKHFTYYDIPYCSHNNKWKYFTFAGSLVNKAIALYHNQTDFEVDDFCLSVKHKLKFSNIPSSPSDFSPFFEDLYEKTSNQSIYQQELPIDMQKHEYNQEWLNNHTIAHILERISKSTPKEMDSSVAKTLDLL
jgi:ATP-dependent Lhr-like helicase